MLHGLTTTESQMAKFVDLRLAYMTDNKLSNFEKYPELAYLLTSTSISTEWYLFIIIDTFYFRSGKLLVLWW